HPRRGDAPDGFHPVDVASGNGRPALPPVLEDTARPAAPLQADPIEGCLPAPQTQIGPAPRAEADRVDPDLDRPGPHDARTERGRPVRGPCPRCSRRSSGNPGKVHGDRTDLHRCAPLRPGTLCTASRPHPGDRQRYRPSRWRSGRRFGRVDVAHFGPTGRGGTMPAEGRDSMPTACQDDRLSALEIARKASLKPVAAIAEEIGIPTELLEPYGGFVAKVGLDAITALADRPTARYVVVTAVTPTPLGEGKTTTTLGP